MSLHEDLRRQAWHLATWEPRRPIQASLRRGVSAAYYALFHLLIDEATGRMFGRGPALRRFRHVLARAYSHQSIAATCKSFHGGTFAQSVVAVLGSRPVPADLREVATTFVKLQDDRHRADYGLGQS